MISDKNKELWVQCPKFGEDINVPNKTVGKWIPVSEGLPENCVDVLICDVADGFIAVGFLDEERWVCRDWFFDMEEITHWMPLPELPQEVDHGS